MQPLALEEVPCPGCGAPEATLAYEASDHVYAVERRALPIRRCDRCALVYLGRRPTRESIAAAYPATYLWRLAETEAPEGAGRDRRLAAAYFRWFYARRAAMADRLLPAGPVRVLDLGCGDGQFLAALARRREGEFVGIDFAPGPSPPGVTLEPGDLNAPGPGDVPFDLVTLWHVLEHLHAPCEALTAAFDRLRPGGRLIVATQNFDALSRRLMGPRWPLNDVPRHLCHFTPATLSALVKRSGFEDVSVRHWTEYFPVLGAHLFAPWMLRPDGRMRAWAGLAASLGLAAFEVPAVAAGWGCTFNLVACRPDR